METIKIGDTVTYRGCWGNDVPKQTKVEGIELCRSIGGKYGKPVKEIDVKNIERGVFDLSDGHWCYGYQIVL